MSRHRAAPALQSAFKRFVRAHRLIRRKARVLVAVSGGLDSVVLLDLLASLRSEWRLTVSILHVNHQLRGRESLEDERFVQRLAKKYGMNIFTARVHTAEEAAGRRSSIQETARHLRYAFFAAKRLELDADAVATAHTANDNAETMFLNFVRGAGIDGLGGIPVERHDAGIVRPLLFASREEIAAYAKEKKLKHREDSSNLTDKYSRNFVRRKVFPLLEGRLNPSLVRTLGQSSKVLRDCAEFVEEQVSGVYGGVVSEENGALSFQTAPLGRLHPYLRQMVVRRALTGRGIEPTSDRISAFLSLLEGEKGMRVDCGSMWTAEKGDGSILLSNAHAGGFFSFALEKEGTVRNGFFSLSIRKCRALPNKFGANSSIEYVDASKVSFPLRIRSWKEGDSFVPLGMKHRKKVSDLFVDLKVSRHAKERVPIVESQGKIVWVGGYRIDDRFKITPSSRGAYKLSISLA